MSTKQKEKVKIEGKHKLLEQVDELGQIILHCHCSPQNDDLLIRIWRSTYLFANDSDHVSQLVHAEHISMFPDWKVVKKNTHHTFTLIFSGLPKTCHSFDMIEDIPEKGGFKFLNIIRSREDIYDVFV